MDGRREPRWIPVLARRARVRQPIVRKLRKCSPALLGVQPSITVDDGSDSRRAGPPLARRAPRLTRYVDRDHDPALRERLAAAARTGGFVLLVGAASTGKTRSAYEAARAVLPKWRVMIPDPARGIAQVAKLPGRTVLWLDEVQRYLVDGGNGLDRGALLTLIHRHRVVVLGTMWPDYYQSLVEQPGRAEISEPRLPDITSRARDLLGLAGQPIHVPDRLSEPERARAARAAADDPRVRAALDHPDVGFTQALAGAADLVRHWRQADRYARAVIDAAVDCRRLGVHGPLTEDLLRACASSLLAVTANTESLDGWFDRAIGYATRELGSATRVLGIDGPRRRRRHRTLPRWAHRWVRRGARHQQPRYQLADYLAQHGQRERFGEVLPEQFLKTLMAGINDGADLFRVAHSLHVRGLHGLAEQLYRRGGRSGDPRCRRGLALLLEEQGEIAEAVAQLAPTAARGDDLAHLLRLRILVAHRDVAALTRLAHGDAEAAWRLAALSLSRGDEDEAVAQLRRLWWTGVYGAAVPLADLLAGAGRYEELAELAAADCIEASLYLLASDEAVTWQETALARAAWTSARDQSRQPYGDPRLRREWLSIEVEAGRPEAAVDTLRQLATLGENRARRQLCQLLHDLGRVEELRALADAGDRIAGWLLADLLRGPDRVRELEALATGGNPNARSILAASLARQGRAREAARWLDIRTVARLLLAHGHGDQARRYAAALATSAVPGDRLLWAKVLAGAGDREQAMRLLTAGLAAGDVEAGQELVRIVIADPDEPAGRDEPAGPNEPAGRDEPAGPNEPATPDGRQATPDDSEDGSEAELRRLACCGVMAARRALIDRLVRTGRGDEADRVRVHGLHPDGSTPQ